LKKILFVSFLDFKEKSIQVIRKTPEAYRDAGWDVRYLVARDNSTHDNYLYERVFDVSGISIERHILPWNKLINKISNRALVRILNKSRYLLYVVKYSRLIVKSFKEKPFDVLYGYEYHGVLACKLALRNRALKNVKFVSRFQGTFFHEYFQSGRHLKILANLDHLFALKTSSDLSIMTNDGTQGDKALTRLKSGHLYNMKFLVNGVSDFPFTKREVLNLGKGIRILTVSRIVGWKRLDRVVNICSSLLTSGFTDFSLTMVGDGPEKEAIQKRIKEKGLENHISMAGSLPHHEINERLRDSDVFFSFYDSSNVGNPLLEAIRANKIIFTLNNGDTGSWIKHRENGFIYNPEEDFEKAVCTDLVELSRSPVLSKLIIKGIAETEKSKLWTWEERFNYEIESVEALLDS